MNYDMVFEGGGAKGMVFVGAMQEFEARGHHHHRLLGTSAGAITASLLAAGYSSAEMLTALSEQKEGKSIFVGFMAEPSAFKKELVLTSGTLAFLRKLNLPIPGFIRGRMEDDLVLWLATEPGLRSAYSLLEYGGWYSADNFIAWMQERLDTGSYNGKPRSFSGLTLSQFYDQTHTDLSVVASDTTGGAMLVLNHMTAPDLPLVWAVRMSMSIPLVWQAVVWLEQWGLYRGQDMSGHIIVDGGLLSNFPIELFVSDDVTVKNVMGPKDTDSVLGLLIDETLPVGPAQTAVPQAPPVTISDFPAIQRLSSLVNTTLSARDKMVIDAFEKLVARMPAMGYGTTEFDMSDQKRAALVDAGRAAMKTYFDNAAAEPASFDLSMEGSAEEAKAKEKADKVALKILSR